MANKTSFYPPKFLDTSFNCPICGAFSNQSFISVYNLSRNKIDDLSVCYCAHCRKYSIWYEGEMIYPNFSSVDIPNEDLSEDIKADYIEASEIVQRSPRGAAALLRLAVQKLCLQLGEKDKDLNVAIGNLVKNGLPVMVQKSLNSLRVIGNEAVHPGQMDLKDDIDTANSLFKLLNFIAEKMITEPNEIGSIFDSIPDSKKDQIAKRDTGQ